MEEIRPDTTPKEAPAIEKEAAARSGEAPRWGKGTENPEDGRFLEGPQARTHELKRLFRIAADFIRGFRALHFVGPCVTVFGSARFPEDHRYCAMAREVGRRLGRAGFTVLTGGGPGIMEAANRGVQTGKIRSFPLVVMGTDYWKPLSDFICHGMVQEKTILPADCERILFTDSVDEMMDRIMSAATQELGLVWEAAPRWYFGEGRLQKPRLDVSTEPPGKA